MSNIETAYARVQVLCDEVQGARFQLNKLLDALLVAQESLWMAHRQERAAKPLGTTPTPVDGLDADPRPEPPPIAFQDLYEVCPMGWTACGSFGYLKDEEQSQ